MKPLATPPRPGAPTVAASAYFCAFASSRPPPPPRPLSGKNAGRLQRPRRRRWWWPRGRRNLPPTRRGPRAHHRLRRRWRRGDCRAAAAAAAARGPVRGPGHWRRGRSFSFKITCLNEIAIDLFNGSFPWHISGQVDVFFLERGRATGQADGELSFHGLYQMVAGGAPRLSPPPT